MFDTIKSPAAIVQEKGLAQVSDTSAIEEFSADAIAANPGPTADFKKDSAVRAPCIETAGRISPSRRRF